LAIRHPVIRRYTARQGYGETAGAAREWIKKELLTQQDSDDEQAYDHPSKQDRLGLSHSASPAYPNAGRDQRAASASSLDHLIGALEDRAWQ
jgi:hypothetical protein